MLAPGNACIADDRRRLRKGAQGGHNPCRRLWKHMPIVFLAYLAKSSVYKVTFWRTHSNLFFGGQMSGALELRKVIQRFLAALWWSYGGIIIGVGKKIETYQNPLDILMPEEIDQLRGSFF
jgi:hypothetical protein